MDAPFASMKPSLGEAVAAEAVVDMAAVAATMMATEVVAGEFVDCEWKLHVFVWMSKALIFCLHTIFDL